MLVRHCDTGGPSLSKERYHVRTVRRVGDQEDLIRGLQIGDHVVNYAALGIAHQCVLGLAWADLSQIGGQTSVDEVRRAGAGHRSFAEMADVKDADSIANSRVLGQDSRSGVLQWHRPAAERCELRTGGDMP